MKALDNGFPFQLGLPIVRPAATSGLQAWQELKMRITLTVIAMTIAMPAQAADNSAGCRAQRSSIESSIASAQTRGNQRELRGLRRALQASIANCSAEALEADRQARIADVRAEIAEREQDLAKAEIDGDAGKIAKRRAKLDEARAELEAALEPIPQ